MVVCERFYFWNIWRIIFWRGWGIRFFRDIQTLILLQIVRIDGYFLGKWWVFLGVLIVGSPPRTILDTITTVHVHGQATKIYAMIQITWRHIHALILALGFPPLAILYDITKKRKLVCHGRWWGCLGRFDGVLGWCALDFVAIGGSQRLSKRQIRGGVINSMRPFLAICAFFCMHGFRKVERKNYMHKFWALIVENLHPEIKYSSFHSSISFISLCKYIAPQLWATKCISKCILDGKKNSQEVQMASGWIIDAMTWTGKSLHHYL